MQDENKFCFFKIKAASMTKMCMLSSGFDNRLDDQVFSGIIIIDGGGCETMNYV